MSGTGVAIFPAILLKSNKTVLPKATAVLRVPKKSAESNSALFICNYIADRFRQLLLQFSVSLVIIEWPEFWGQSGRSYAASATGDLLWNACLIGTFIRTCNERHLYSIQLIPAAKWKGQLTKDAVAKRVQKITGAKFPNHACDAVGLGLYAQGHFE